MEKEMTILLAPDSFKESMTAKQVCAAMARGIHKANPIARCIEVPMADGGEGTMQSLVDATGGTVHMLKVKGPLGSEVEASYGIMGDGKTAVLEMASASGIGLIPKEARNPLLTTTFGTGQLLRAVLDHDIDRILIGIGGSATNDGGAGMLQALGGRLLDDKGCELGPGGAELRKLARIDLSDMDPRMGKVKIEVACDVTNPLCGPAGASYVFGPQKGATPGMAAMLDAGLRHYADVIQSQMGKTIADVPGAGAAGGLGAGLMVFLNGVLKKGVELVIEYTGLEAKIRQADMVWTGEGSIDVQTKFGKTPFGVAQVAQKHAKPVIAFAGHLGEGISELYGQGIDAVFGIMPGACTLETALQQGEVNMERAAENVMRLLMTRKREN
ncbi:glycerate kinase family protein [Paenibacillus azoreducens]|uniref:Glycerate kinase n=1 Tax=Paenibacillus azoreducens TaxID=116718 RepID=A0A919YFG4_9BACL|nr:glycerate kinase [Paenibacillus azoreducens]GIO50706.1 glycerate kinase [Paenibacillus azoreducens]